ncbi:DUF2764 family protein [Accumulibacter sp.]|uniref:DUF2764 family protein n=1 Tax=Accumulibacter sp. TaxID=2053492 RepID=UPI0025D47709|nr:DUF2764 family protein [Accumulibacter sp.]MCM8610954.1 DUF2764 domain-containing protein [Accumulibacter sp.]MCM8634774.1 DUF2764 domain-containing protein [Accumulibacter sp.]MCM8638328.1 DUF2764 domain-containing protein [Accumulibacter sp.]
MSYHYLVASLPMLSLDAPPPFSSLDFLSRCHGVLKSSDLAVLEAIVSGSVVVGNAVAATWTARETQTRNLIAQFRAARLGVDPRPFLRDHSGYDVALAQAVTDALAAATPVEREQALDRCRWRIAEELSLADPFGFASILAFAIRLRIAERWARLTEPAGERQAEALLATMSQAPDTAAHGDTPDNPARPAAPRE